MWKPLAAAIAILAASLPARAAAPEVVVSIQPLHSLTAAVMAGIAEPKLLVTGTRSEHTYALKPSDARMLQGADMVVLVDDHFESFLAKPLKTLSKSATALAMADLPGMTRLPLRQGGVWRNPSEHDHGHGEDFDGHLWLDPANARVLVTALAAALAGRDPGHAGAYRANADATLARLDALDAELRARLAPVAGRPYVVFHDAYQYFERAYGLSPAGALTVDPDRPVSAKRLADLRDRLKATGATCVFREPQFAAQSVASLAEAAGTRIGVLDPQGAAIPPGPDHYFRLMAELGQSLTECLSGR